MPAVKANRKSRPEIGDGGPRYDRVLMKPGKYEVTEDSLFTIRIPLAQRKGERWWVVVSDVNAAETVEDVVFRMWTYDEMIELRKLSTKYDNLRRVHTIDHDMMNRMKIQRFMVRWSFGDNNPRLELKHVQGVLSDECWKAVTKLQTNILKHIIEEMNERYEYGG
jgi:hypothetical protein